MQLELGNQKCVQICGVALKHSYVKEKVTEGQL